MHITKYVPLKRIEMPTYTTVKVESGCFDREVNRRSSWTELMNRKSALNHTLR